MRLEGFLLKLHLVVPLSLFLLLTDTILHSILLCFYMQFVADKVAYALSQGIKVIACVGETLEQRESGSTVAVVAAQTKSIAGISLLLTKHYF